VDSYLVEIHRDEFRAENDVSSRALSLYELVDDLLRLFYLAKKLVNALYILVVEFFFDLYY